MAQIITVDGSIEKINIAPRNVVEEVEQNLRMLLSTPKYSVPLYRDFGVSWDVVDKPMDAARSLMVGEIMSAVERYEPRCEIVEIRFKRDEMNARLYPTLEVIIHAE